MVAGSLRPKVRNIRAGTLIARLEHGRRVVGSETQNTVRFTTTLLVCFKGFNSKMLTNRANVQCSQLE